MDPKTNEFWTQPVLEACLIRLASHFGLDYEDLLDATAVHLFSKMADGQDTLEDILAYTFGIAHRVARSLNRVTLERAGKSSRESSHWLHREATRLASRSAEESKAWNLEDLRATINAAVSPDMRSLISAWESLPPGKSPAKLVAQALGVTLPTARKRIERERKRLQAALPEYR